VAGGVTVHPGCRREHGAGSDAGLLGRGHVDDGDHVVGAAQHPVGRGDLRDRAVAGRLEGDRQGAVRGGRLDPARPRRAGGQRVAEQPEEQGELITVERAEVAEPSRPAGRQPPAGRLGLGALRREQLLQPLACLAAIHDPRRAAAALMVPGGVEARTDPHRRRVGPARGGGHWFLLAGLQGVGVDGEMPRGCQPERGAPQTVRIGVARRLREPSRQGAEVGRPVASARATLLQGGHRSEQCRDGRAGSLAQQCRL
jgi:hypothetical protein